MCSERDSLGALNTLTALWPLSSSGPSGRAHCRLGRVALGLAWKEHGPARPGPGEAASLIHARRAQDPRGQWAEIDNPAPDATRACPAHACRQLTAALAGPDARPLPAR